MPLQQSLESGLPRGIIKSRVLPVVQYALWRSPPDRIDQGADPYRLESQRRPWNNRFQHEALAGKSYGVPERDPAGFNQIKKRLVIGPVGSGDDDPAARF